MLIINKKIKKEGFTVVEVLTVIGIIAILTVIIFPAINNIRAKNRDAERVSDIAAIQLGLSLYKNQISTNEYPKTIFNNPNFTPKYVPAASLLDPNNNPYPYVSLSKGTETKCSYYHLGVELELPSALIDPQDLVVSSSTLTGLPPNARDLIGEEGYNYCDSINYFGPGINGTLPLMYDVHP